MNRRRVPWLSAQGGSRARWRRKDVEHGNEKHEVKHILGSSGAGTRWRLRQYQRWPGAGDGALGQKQRVVQGGQVPLCLPLLSCRLLLFCRGSILDIPCGPP
jgi:hypothetical protein